MKQKLRIILLTVFLDILWLGMVIPVLPFIVEWFWFSEFYVGLTYAIYALWMFLWWILFWRLSDKFWRNRILEVTISLNIIWYTLFYFSQSLELFLAARFIGGLWASGFAVWQAYIADISDNSNRTTNMWLIWAMFGIGFLIWPVFGWYITSLEDWHILWLISGILAVINFFVVLFLLPKISKDESKAKQIDEKHLHKSLKNKLKSIDKNILVLFLVTFVTALGFSSMQSTFSLIMNDRFSLTEKDIWFLFGFIWIVAMLYQAWVIKFVRKYLIEKQMLIFGFIILAISFVLMSVNNYFYAIFFIIFMFPVWYGTINPATSSMLSKLSPTNIGKTLWINSSMMSIWNVLWPFLSGILYIKWSGLPYISSSILFLIAMCLVIFLVNVKVKEK